MKVVWVVVMKGASWAAVYRHSSPGWAVKNSAKTRLSLWKLVGRPQGGETEEHERYANRVVRMRSYRTINVER